MQTKFKQLLLLLLIWTQVSWLGVAHSKDSIAAPSLLLANELGPNVDPAKYFISEKYELRFLISSPIFMLAFI